MASVELQGESKRQAVIDLFDLRVKSNQVTGKTVWQVWLRDVWLDEFWEDEAAAHRLRDDLAEFFASRRTIYQVDP